MEKRNVEFYEYKKMENGKYEKVLIGSGIFHQFGFDYEEFESGLAVYSIAIIELTDGTVRNIPSDMIKFIS